MKKVIDIKIPTSESFNTEYTTSERGYGYRPRSSYVKHFNGTNRSDQSDVSITDRPTTAYVSSSKVLTLNLEAPKCPPSLLERYWRYNNIKKSAVITNRYKDEYEATRSYIFYTEENNIPNLITPKSFKSKTVNFRPSTGVPKHPVKQEIKEDPNETTTTSNKPDISIIKKRCSSATPESMFGNKIKSNLSSKIDLSEFYDIDVKKNHIKKLNSVYEFNKFKNKFINQKASFRPLELVSSNYLPITRIVIPNNENSKYIDTLEIKRLNHVQMLKKRQVYLSKSLSIKKLQ